MGHPFPTDPNAQVEHDADGFTAEGPISAGPGAPVRAGAVGDAYFRLDGGDGTWLYRCTVAGDAATAVWVAKL